MRSNLSWSTAVVRETHDLTAGIRAFDLEPQDGLLPFAPGSHLDVSVLVGGRAQVRSYSLVGRRNGCYRIAVRRADDGRGGSRYLWSLERGARLQVSEPKNHFELKLGRPQYLLVAGGIGVTPIITMAQALMAAGADVSMVYAARSRDELAFLDLLRDTLGERLTCCLDDENGRIDAAALMRPLHPQAECYVCGPIGLLDAMRRAWASAGRPLAMLRYETFGNSGRFAPEPFEVRVPRHGLTVTVAADASMLDALTAAGVDILSDCRRGECGLCMVDVVAVQGTVDHRDVFLSDAEKAANRKMCACVSRVVGGGVTLDSSYREDALSFQPWQAAQ